MNRTIIPFGFLILVVSIITISITTLAQAQLINHERTERLKQKTAFAVPPSVASEIIEIYAQDQSESAAQETVAMTEPVEFIPAEMHEEEVTVEPTRENYAVQNRIERMYDLDENEILNPDEIADFYKDVVASVKRRGSFTVTSDLLKSYDADNDGLITDKEIFQISADIQ